MTPEAAVAPAAPPAGAISPTMSVQAQHAGACTCEPFLRVGRVLQDMAAARVVSDSELLQHAADCRLLMEAAYERFEESGNPADREEAVLWMERARVAHQALSPAWKAAREAEIQRGIAEGVGYFAAQGDAARTQLEGRPAGA